MPDLIIEEITRFIEPNIQVFHHRRLESIRNLSLKKILLRKNPYLFKAKNLTTAHSLVQSLLDAHLSSQEEGIFGEFLETIAIFVCGRVYGGRKSSTEGIDLEFEKERDRYIVSIKSGPNWGNSRQIAKMKDDFKRAKRILANHKPEVNIVAVNGCCYGKDDRPNKGDYYKLRGQRFWEFISGKERLYVDIIEPLGYNAKQKNDQFSEEYSIVVNRFTREFLQEYCDANGRILWEKLVKLNSGRKI